MITPWKNSPFLPSSSPPLSVLIRELWKTLTTKVVTNAALKLEPSVFSPAKKKAVLNSIFLLALLHFAFVQLLIYVLLICPLFAELLGYYMPHHAYTALSHVYCPPVTLWEKVMTVVFSLDGVNPPSSGRKRPESHGWERRLDGMDGTFFLFFFQCIIITSGK